MINPERRTGLLVPLFFQKKAIDQILHWAFKQVDYRLAELAG